MTISVAWVRRVNNYEELVFTSDSRLSGDGNYFDCSPKILTLGRHHCAIAFGGVTNQAFPVMLQLATAMHSHEPLKVGSLDVAATRTHALKIFNVMYDLLKPGTLVRAKRDGPDIDDDLCFLFGGYDWLKKSFELSSLDYSRTQGKFKAEPAYWLFYNQRSHRFSYRRTKSYKAIQPASQIVFAGDQAEAAQENLLARLSQKYPEGTKFQGLDWEPFEVVRDMLRDEKHCHTIGGAPQVVKVHQHMNAYSYAVYWPDRTSNQIFLHGRTCLEYERLSTWVLDPDSLKSENPFLAEHPIDFLNRSDDSRTKGRRSI
jgi:hypothetical protein